MTIPNDPKVFRQQLLDVLRAAGHPLTADEIRQQLDLPDDKHTSSRLYQELNRLYTMRRVEVDRRADPVRRRNMWRVAGGDSAGGGR